MVRIIIPQSKIIHVDYINKHETSSANSRYGAKVTGINFYSSGVEINVWTIVITQDLSRNELGCYSAFPATKDRAGHSRAEKAQLDPPKFGHCLMISYMLK